MKTANNVADHEGFLARLNLESPRSRIVLESGFLEEILQSAILLRLVPNRSSTELFGEESSVSLPMLAKYAHALGLIGKEELVVLKKFSTARNMIAHSWKCDFGDLGLQKIADSIQFISLAGEKGMPDHQRCFSKLDYLGVYLIEEFTNRFSSIPTILHHGGTFVTKLMVDPATGEKSRKVGPDK